MSENLRDPFEKSITFWQDFIHLYPSALKPRRSIACWFWCFGWCRSTRLLLYVGEAVFICCCFCLKSAVVCTCCDTYSRSQAPYKLAIFSVLLFACLCCCCSKRATEELSALGSSRMGTVAGATAHLTASYSCQVIHFLSLSLSQTHFIVWILRSR
jgi:hypothetical protein